MHFKLEVHQIDNLFYFYIAKSSTFVENFCQKFCLCEIIKESELLNSVVAEVKNSLGT